MRILRISRPTADATETTYEIPAFATIIAVVTALAAVGNFVINLATHYPSLKAFLRMS